MTTIPRKYKCNKHPRYQGVRPPSSGCDACVKVYVNVKGLSELLHVGCSLSNMFFNYAQDSLKFNEKERQYLREWVAKWDNAYQIFKTNVR
jgi:hypothetical protein